MFDPHTLLIGRVDSMVEAIDPEAFSTLSHSWRLHAEDSYTGGLLAQEHPGRHRASHVIGARRPASTVSPPRTGVERRRDPRL